MDMQTAISEKTRRALWDLLAEQDTVDNTLSKASEILAAAECFGINVDSDTFRSQDEIIRIEALIKHNAPTAQYPTVKSLVTRLLDIQLKRQSSPTPSSSANEGNTTVVKKQDLQTDDKDSDFVMGPVIYALPPKRKKLVVESDNEEQISDDEVVHIPKRRHTAESESRTGSCIGWPQELFEEFGRYKGSKWCEKKPLLMKLWADGLKDGRLQKMTGSEACNNCQRTGYDCLVPPGIVDVRCLHCQAARPNPKCSLIPGSSHASRRARSASSVGRTAPLSEGSASTLKKDSASPAPIQQTTSLIERFNDMQSLLNQVLVVQELTCT